MKVLNSPATGKPMRLVKEPETREFRKEEYTIMSHYFLCEKTGQRFLSDELTNINETQVHNQYREKYGIPFPDEIRQIREQYDISASKMSEILGFGTNSYRLYESGDIPSVANGRLILAVKDPRDFIKQVEASSHILTDKEKNQILMKATELIAFRKRHHWQFLNNHFIKYDVADEYSGYRKPNFDKITNVIAFFSYEVEDLLKTKLNKLLFYSDFGCYQGFGHSITGITYRAIQMGPVPAEYDKIYLKLAEDERIVISEREYSSGHYGEVFAPAEDFEESVFEDYEIDVLHCVAKTFKKAKTTELVELSHREIAWEENEGSRSLISYQKHAFHLKNLDLCKGGKR